MNIALFASGNGSNVQAIIDAVENGRLDAVITCVVCDRPGAYVTERAKRAGLPLLVSSPKEFAKRKDWEHHIIEFLQTHDTEWLVLAGFMRILKEPLLRAFPNRIINIHPSFLPAFPGKNGIQDAYEAGVSETGVSVFFVDEGIDTGSIIAQERIPVNPDWTLEELEAAVHKVEHRLYPAVIQQLSEQHGTNRKGEQHD